MYVLKLVTLFQTDGNISPNDCIESVKLKFSTIHSETAVWEEVLKNLPKKSNSVKSLRKQREHAMGLNPRLLSHYKKLIVNKDI